MLTGFRKTIEQSTRDSLKAAAKELSRLGTQAELAAFLKLAESPNLKADVELLSVLKLCTADGPATDYVRGWFLVQDVIKKLDAMLKDLGAETEPYGGCNEVKGLKRSYVMIAIAQVLVRESNVPVKDNIQIIAGSLEMSLLPAGMAGSVSAHCPAAAPTLVPLAA